MSRRSSVLLFCAFASLFLLAWNDRSGCVRTDGRQELVIFAASSLTDVFRDLEQSFEEANPDVDVIMNFAGSQLLRLQIEQGAPAHVFVSANAQHMDALVMADMVRQPFVFAYNGLVVAVPTANPAGILEFSELPRAERIVIGMPGVPIGRYTRDLLQRANRSYGGGFEAEVMDRVVSQEANVRLVRMKVRLAEADAAIVYRTDVGATDQVMAVEIPPELNVRAEYQIGVVHRSGRAGLAGRWIDHLRTEEGRRTLQRHGFANE